MATREPIYAAFWDLLLNDPRLAGVFVTTSRFLPHFTEPAPEQMPALFLIEKGETWTKAGKGIPAVRVLRSHIVMYAWNGSDKQPLPSTLCNTMLDVIDDIIEQPNNPGNVQTLGGLVEHVYLIGQVEIYEGLLQEVSIVVVPIEMLLP